MNNRTLRGAAPLVALACGLAAPAVAQAPDRSAPPRLGPPPALTLPVIERVTLANGLTVLYMPKREVPLVQINVVVKVGQADDPADRPGLASMTAAMLDEGAGERTALELSDEVEFLGASLFAGGDDHSTTVALHVPRAKLEAALPLLADVVLRPRFDGDELERQRRERLTTMTQWRDEPRAIAQAEYIRALYGDRHPYGRMALGSPASVASMTVEHLRAFHRTWFMPGNAAVIVVGDVALAEIRPMLERAFGGWAQGAVPARTAPATPQVGRRRVILVDKPGAAQSEIRIGMPAVSRETPDYDALVAMNTVLGGSFTSRLNQKLREEKQYTYGARSGFEFGKYPGPFTAQAAVQTNVTDSALVEFMRELRGIREPVPEDELARARNYAALRFPARFQSVASIANQLEELYVYDLPADYYNGYVQRLLAVSRADARRVARRYIDPDRFTVVVVGDRASIEQGIRALNLGPVEVLTVEDVFGKE